MELVDAKELTLKLLQDHGLTQKGWSFGWIKTRRRLGECEYSTKQISLSVYYVTVNEISAVRNTILHEIAHALCPVGTGHGRLWKVTAISIGCIPEATTSRVVSPAPKYRAKCPRGCEIGATWHRKPQKHYRCAQCHKRGIDSRIELVKVR